MSELTKAQAENDNLRAYLLNKPPVWMFAGYEILPSLTFVVPDGVYLCFKETIEPARCKKGVTKLKNYVTVVTDEEFYKPYPFCRIKEDIKRLGFNVDTYKFLKNMPVNLLLNEKANITGKTGTMFNTSTIETCNKLILSAIKEASYELYVTLDETNIKEMFIDVVDSFVNVPNPKFILCKTDFEKLKKKNCPFTQDTEGKYYFENFEVIPVDDKYFTNKYNKKVGGYLYIGELENIVLFEKTIFTITKKEATERDVPVRCEINVGAQPIEKNTFLKLINTSA